MIVVRDVFQARYGRGHELVHLFQEARERWSPLQQHGYRILSDASGPFFTVVTEVDVESLAAWEQFNAAALSSPEFGEWFQRMMPLVESGRREFYHLQT